MPGRRLHRRPTSSTTARARARSWRCCAPRRARGGRWASTRPTSTSRDSTGHRSAARRVKEAVRARDGAHLLGRDRPEQARGEGGVGRREAGRLRRADRREARERFAEALARASCRASARRPSRGSSSSASRRSDASAPRPTSSSSQWFGAAARPAPGRARALRGRARASRRSGCAKSESRETTFDRDLRGLPQLEPVLERLTGELCETLAREERRGRTIGIKVRFDDFSTRHARPQPRRRRQRPETVGTVALELLRAPRSAPPGAAPGRARGRAGRGVPRIGSAGRSAQPLALTLVFGPCPRIA